MLFRSPWSLGVLTVPFTVVFILTVVNAFNFIDGVDGLAGGLALVATSTMAAASGDTSLFEVMQIVTSVLVGYLLFNLPLGFNARLRAFMGDTGSTLLGFTIAIALIDITQPAGDRPGMSPVVGVWLVAVPVFDLFAVVGRRLLTGRSPFAADREHLHHKLVDAGLSTREALVVLLVLALGFTCVGVAGSASKVSNAALIGLWFMACFSYYQLSCHAAAVVRLVRTVRLRTLGRWLGSSPSDESFPFQAASRE